MQKKKLIFFLLVIIVAGFGLALPRYASAQWALLGNIGKAVANGIIAIVYSAANTATILLLQFAELVLNWVMDSIDIPTLYKSVVMPAWGIVRNLANMGIVLALVAIAIATILRIREWEWQHTLPVLLIIALLINFSPLICRLIMDGADRVMFYFWDGAKEGLRLSTQFDAVKNLWTNITGNPGTKLAQAASFFVFDLLTVLIMLLYAFLFLGRIIALAFLVIISPLAFLAYAFPSRQIKRYFQMWWNQFFNWCIVGMVAAFTLYIGVLTNQHIHDIVAGGPKVPKEASNTLTGIFIYILPVGILLIGFLFTLSTSASGADILVRGFSSSADWTRKKGWGMTKAAGRAIRNRPKVREAEARVRARLQRVPGVRRVVKGPEAMEAERKKRMEEIGKKYANLNPGQLRNWLAIHPHPWSEEDRIAQAKILEILAEKKALTLTNAERESLLPRAQAMGADMRKIYQARPDWAPEDIRQDILSRMSPEEFRKKVQAEALANPTVVIRVLRDRRTVNEIGNKGTLRQKAQIRDTMRTQAFRNELRRYSQGLTPRERNQLASSIREIRNPNWVV